MGGSDRAPGMPNPKPRRSTILRRGTVAVIAGLVAILATAVLAPAQPRPRDKVTFQFAWIPYGEYAGFYLARELGYYDEAGIEVSFIRGHGVSDSLKTLAAGVAQLGEITQIGSIGGRARNISVREVLMYHDKAMEVFYCLDKHGIRKPRDREGKSIGGPLGAGARNLFPAFAALHGIDAAKVSFVDMSPDTMAPAVITGRVHCASNFITERPTYQKAAAQAGEKISGIVYSDWGLDLQANDAVRAFHKSFPEANPELLREHWKIAVEHMLTPPAYEHGLGWIDPARKKRTIEVYTKHIQLPREVGLDEMMTNEFNPRIKPPRR